MSAVKFRLKQALSVWRDAASGALRIGVAAPTALAISDPPDFLPAMLEALSTPRAPQELLGLMAQAYPAVTRETLRDAFLDLLKLGVVHPAFPEGRYHRHQLYFDFFDVRPADYEALAGRRVGLIGTGGIGSTCAMLLAAAGVGNLVCSDGDRIEETNLTRTILFEESDIGSIKVEAARARLAARNRGVSVRAVPSKLESPDLLREHFADCDVWILSADTPVDVHRWTNEVAIERGIPYVNAGYVEVTGAVGPFVIPGVTACAHCVVLGGDGPAKKWNELNRSFQAPSYGPLNALVSAIAVNEVLRYLLGLEVSTRGRRLRVSSSTYEVSFVDTAPAPGCFCGAHARATGQSAAASAGAQAVEQAGDGDRFHALAENYKQFRDSKSLNAFVLDDLVIDLVGRGQGLRIMDVGCGIGTLALPLAERGHRVTGLDTSAGMLEEFRRRIPAALASSVTLIEGDALAAPWDGPFDRVLLNLIIDHIEDPAPLLARAAAALAPGGQVVVVVPHPVKDAGRWQKERVDGRWRYRHMVMDDYFREGPIEKAREDDQGNVVIASITTHRRTISTYFRMLVDAGLRVDELIEPRPPVDPADDSVNYAKTSRIPYFLVFRCSAQASPAETV